MLRAASIASPLARGTTVRVIDATLPDMLLLRRYRYEALYALCCRLRATR